MRTLRFLRALALASSAALAFVPLAGCPAPDPPKAPVAKPPSEEEARDALEAAKAKGDIDALFSVHNKYEKFPSGKKALRLAVRKLLEEALDFAEKCDLSKAAGDLASVAPYTADDAAINTAYDETKARVDGEEQHCALVKMDEDVKRAEEKWDWPRAFNRIATEKSVDDTKLLTKRRVELLGRYSKFLDDTLKMIVSKKSVAGVVDDKKDEWDASTDPSKLPPEVGVELAKRADAIAGVMLVFDKLEGGQLVDPPVRYWTFGKARPRRTDTPGIVGQSEMANGISFHVVARGKMGDVTLLCWGQAEGTVLQRLASIKALVVDVDAKTYDTNTALPDQLVGARVLAPVVAGGDILTPSVVLSEINGAIQVLPVSSSIKKLTTPKINTKKEQLRGLVLPPGTPVMVLAGTQWKKAEVADAPEEDRVMVKINGFETPVSIGDVRVKRSDLPKAE